MSMVKQRVVNIVNGRDPNEITTLVPVEPGESVITLPEGVDRRSAEEKLTLFQDLLQSGTATVDEIRKKEGLPPIEDCVPSRERVVFTMVAGSYQIMPRDPELLVPFMTAAGLTILPRIAN